MVITAGETRLTMSAYETTGPAVPFGGPLLIGPLLVPGSDVDASRSAGLRWLHPGRKTTKISRVPARAACNFPIVSLLLIIPPYSLVDLAFVPARLLTRRGMNLRGRGI